MSSQNIVGSGYPLQDNVLFDAITEKSIVPFVFARQKQYSRFDNIIVNLNNGESTRSAKRELKTPFIGDLTVSANVSTRTSISTTMLVLTLTDEAQDDFLNLRAVMSSTGTMGQVKAHAPGSLTLEFLASPTGATAFVSGDFAAGTQLTQLFDVSPGVTGGRENNLYVPQLDTNYIGQETYEYTITREDMADKTVVKYGREMWQWANQDIFMREMNNSRTWRRWISLANSTRNKVMPGGFKWQIQNQGGMQGTYDGTLDENKLMEITEEIHARGNGTTEMLVKLGAGAMAGLQLGTGARFITYAGKQNTIGGQTVIGIDFDVWKCNGIKFIFELYFPFNNSNLNPEGLSTIKGKLKTSYTAVFFDTTPVDTFGFGQKPFVTPYHYGPDAMGASTVKGRIDFEGNYVSEATNKINACSIIFEDNMLWQLNDPTRHYLLQISA